MFGFLPAERLALFGDVDGDGAADMLGYDQTSETATLSSSTRESFEAPTSFGSFPSDYRLDLIDGDANGQADLAGERALLGDLRVALTDMAYNTGPPAGDWEPDPDIVYDDDPTLSVPDEPIEPLFAPMAEPQAERGEKRNPLLLGFQDERRLNARYQIPDTGLLRLTQDRAPADSPPPPHATAARDHPR